MDTPRRTKDKASNVDIRYFQGDWIGVKGAKMRSVGEDTAVIIKEYSGGSKEQPQRKKRKQPPVVSAFVVTVSDGRVLPAPWSCIVSNESFCANFNSFMDTKNAVLVRGWRIYSSCANSFKKTHTPSPPFSPTTKMKNELLIK